MSEELAGLCIRHDDIRHIRIYCDYMDIYQNNEHKCKIVRILETWTNSKYAVWLAQAKEAAEKGKPVAPFDGWVTMSYKQFIEYMYGTSKFDAVKSNLSELVEKDKHVERRVNPEDPYGSPQYRLNLVLIQQALDKRNAERTPVVSTPPGFYTPGGGVRNTPTQGGEIPPPRGEKSPPSNNSNNNTTKEEDNVDVAHADIDTASLSEHEKHEQQPTRQEVSVLPPEKTENAPDGQKTENGTSSQKNGSQGLKQGGDKKRRQLPIAPEVQAPTQEALLNVTPITAKLKAWQMLPEGEPVEPVVTAETVITPAIIVEFVEAKIGRRFDTTLTGKKKIAERSQQFTAAGILLNSGFTFADFRLAYDTEATWRSGEITVVDLQHPTRNGISRIQKILNDIRATARKQIQQNTTQQETKQQPTVPIVIEKYKPENIAAFHKRIIEEAEAAAKTQAVDDLGLPPPTEEEIALVEAMMREREEARYAAKKRA